jgi:hypothetical protein
MSKKQRHGFKVWWLLYAFRQMEMKE